MALSDAEVAIACNKWLSCTDMSGTEFAVGWPGSIIAFPNPQTKKGVDDLPRVEVRFMPVQPQQLTLGFQPKIVRRHNGNMVIGGGTARRQFVYVATLVAKSQEFQYDAQDAADKLARRFLFGTRLSEIRMSRFMTAAMASVGVKTLSLDQGALEFKVTSNEYVGCTFILPDNAAVYTVVSHGTKDMPSTDAVDFDLKEGIAAQVDENKPLTEDADAPGLWVRAPVQTGPGYQDGTEWRLPVTINLETLAKI